MRGKMIETLFTTTKTMLWTIPVNLADFFKKKDLGISWLVWRNDKELWNTEQSNDSSVVGGLKSSQGSVIITITQR